MAGSQLDLIAMADIARLAGQSRAAVGNWKARYEDFPQERGRGPRGPLYDRAEVVAWLKETKRLDEKPQEVEAIWRLLERCRDQIKTEDALLMLLMLLGARSQATDEEWQRIVEEGDALRSNDAVRSAFFGQIPFAAELLAQGEIPTEFAWAAVSTLSSFGRDRLPALAEAVLLQFAKAVPGGLYLTPKPLRELMIGLAEPVGSVYNPATGVGQLLVDAATFASASGPVESDAGRMYGQEVAIKTWAIAQLNLTIHGVKAYVEQGDAFRDDSFRDLRADCVVAVPPWNQKLATDRTFENDPRWVFGEPGPNDGNAAWIQHCLYHLADSGRAVLLLPNNVLSEGGRAGRIRQRIIKAGLLDAVIGLPPNLLSWTPVPSAILIFSKASGDRPGEPASLMIDLSDRFTRTGRESAATQADVIHQVIHTYQQWVAGELSNLGNAAVAGFEDIAANDFVIVPARYQSIAPGPNIKEAKETRRELVRRFQTLSAASLHADKQLSKVLGVER